MTQYSFTEKKRIRKSFAKRASVLPVPFLLETQLASYRAFLQAVTAPRRRARTKGCRPRSRRSSRSPATRATRGWSSSSYSLLPPAFDVTECQQRGLTYCSALRAKVRLILMDKEAPKETVKEVKEQEVYMGEIPLMTDNGSFIINGTERVIVSQLHRSPGVFFEHDRGKTHSSGKLLFSARVIPYRGSWLDFEFDPKDYLYFRVDRRRKMPVTTLLEGDRAHQRGHPQAVLRLRRVPSGRRRARRWTSCPSACAARSPSSTCVGKDGKVLVQKDKRITARHIRELVGRAASRRSPCPTTTSSAARWPRTSSNKDTGEILASANDEITDELLAKLLEAGVAKIQTIYVERPRPGAVHLADAQARRHAGPDRGAGRDLSHDASRRAADRGSGRGAVPRPRSSRKSATTCRRSAA